MITVRGKETEEQVEQLRRLAGLRTKSEAVRYALRITLAQYEHNDDALQQFRGALTAIDDRPSVDIEAELHRDQPL